MKTINKTWITWKRKCLAALLIVGLVLTAGCWSRRELNQLGIVLGTGFDLGEKGQVEVTAQIVKPDAMKAGGGKDGGGGGQSSPVLILSSQGKSTFDAVRNFISVSSKRLFWSHNEIYIFGESLAIRGVGPVLDFLERNPELRREAALLVAKGKAKDILTVPGGLEKVSAIEINHALFAANFLSKASKVDMHSFLLAYGSKATSPTLPAIELVTEFGKPKFMMTVMAVFKQDKLAGWLDETETRGLLWVIDKVKGGIIVVPSPGKAGKLSLEIKQAKVKTAAKLQGGKPEITVEIEEVANLDEETTAVDITKPEIMSKINQAQQQAISQEVQTAVNKAQKLKADIFGFGEELHRANPQQWTKLKPSWDEIFPKLKIKVQVKTKIQFTGQKTAPTIPK